MGCREWWSNASDKCVRSVVFPAQQLFELLSSRTDGQELGGIGGGLPAPAPSGITRVLATKNQAKLTRGATTSRWGSSCFLPFLRARAGSRRAAKIESAEELVGETLTRCHNRCRQRNRGNAYRDSESPRVSGSPLWSVPEGHTLGAGRRCDRRQSCRSRR
jgi:hypothetical protein